MAPVQRRNRRQRSQPPQEVVRPLTPLEIANNYQEQELQRRKNLKFMCIGFLWTFVLGSACTVIAHYYTKKEVEPLKRGHRVVVALTTTPGQIIHLEPTLQSLIDRQKLSPHMVHLILPEQTVQNGTKTVLSYDIPRFVRSYEERGKLLVLQPEVGYGPIDSVIYGIEMESYDTRVILVDGRFVYGPRFVLGLYQKTHDYPDAVVAYSGAKLRGFRKIGDHRLETNKPPHLFLQFSGTKTFVKEGQVDIVQKFAGVCVQRRFFDVSALRQLVEKLSVDSFRDTSDFLLSAYLEKQGIARVLVTGGKIPSTNKQASDERTPGLPLEAAMETVYSLQQELSIWTKHKFIDYVSLSKEEKEAIHCDATFSTPCNESLLTKLDSFLSA